MRQDITCVFEGVAGVGGIYISNLKAAQNIQLLNSLGIKAIVTAVRNGGVYHDKSDITDHLYVPADDHEAYDLARHFQQTYTFIDNVRKKTNVLVHCYAGISRSATIVIAYLLRKYNYSLENVITMVKRRRNKINPNKGFIEQLKKQAVKKGIPDTFNDAPIQEVLDKFAVSKQKKRSTSSYNNYRKKNRNPSKFQNFNQPTSQIKIENLNIQPNVELRQSNQGKNKKQQVYLENEYRKIKQNYSLNKLLKNTSTVMNKYDVEGQEKGEIRKEGSTFEQKLLKIEKFKSKVLQSQKRKKSKQKQLPACQWFSQPSGIDSSKAVGSNKLKENKIEILISTMKRSSDQLQGQPLKKPELLVGEESGHINKINFMENSGIF